MYSEFALHFSRYYMKKIVALFASFVFFVGIAYANEPKHDEHEDNQCIGAGPQAPRDISKLDGSNKVQFNEALSYRSMSLCNVHFHRNAEHKGPAFSTFVKDEEHSGWACQKPTSERLAKGSHVEYEGCEGIAPGDTIEVHWVYTTCDITSEGVKPLGGGLSACMTESCPNPQLRVEAQVFTLTEEGGLRFNDQEPVKNTSKIVQYSGSTTGTSYSNTNCSPYQVNWSVRSSCDSLNIKDFAKWCSHNKYGDHHAHGVRELVTSPALLSNLH